MAGAFAGSSRGHGRRRRRLAVADAPTATEGQDTGAAEPESVAFLGQSPATTDARLMRRAISPRIWKHVIILSCLAAGLLVLAATNGASAVAPTEPTGLSEPTRGVSGILLLLSAQLAIVTGWLRSRSDVDFQGRYRWWKWLGFGLASGAGLLLTGLSERVPDLVATLLEPVIGTVRSARYAVLIVPILTFSGLVLSRVIPDMSRYIWSQVLLLLSILVFSLRLMLIYGTTDVSIGATTLDILFTSASLLCFASMLLHCRFVAFVSNAPPNSTSLAAEDSVPEQKSVAA